MTSSNTGQESATEPTPRSDALEKIRVDLGEARTPAYGDALALCRSLEREVAELKAKPAPRATLAPVSPEIFKRLTRLQTAGCTCQTKTPDIAYHDANCRYRLAREVELLLEEGRAGTAEPGATVQDMAMLMGKLAYALRKHASGVPFAAKVSDQARDYLLRHGLQGSPLRATGVDGVPAN
jgi:hypothetical protein